MFGTITGLIPFLLHKHMTFQFVFLCNRPNIYMFKFIYNFANNLFIWNYKCLKLTPQSSVCLFPEPLFSRHNMYYRLPYFNVLLICFVALYYTKSHYAIIDCTIWYCTVLYDVILSGWCIILCYTSLSHATSKYAALRHIYMHVL
jgi:hypothetical protein